ncbi:thioesterase II family protein [Streptantibioticus silvisoli]|uniref:Thioesterase domain-containing protein n=1 Tax=Streptantibioticus silvisoli TaxID=2705255 RepID=A0ABT6VVH7_9ACTN|nr:alpha/beta fold hydrolase [Streptantibioticus silvisoli]MDI5962488.1 thioesterase domain-containing protein [Streptantibioticus silvisoli]
MSETVITTMATAGRWFQPAEVEPEARIRLFLFPHAGSGAIIYRDWGGLLPADVGMQALTLPGRQERSAEAPFTDWEPLLDALYDAVCAELDDRPFAFFGHCLGAQLAYHLTVRLKEEGIAGPVLLGVSGWAPEGFFNPSEKDVDMPDEELIDWMKRLGSFPAEIYDNPEVLAMVIPALRSDLAVCSRRVERTSAVDCPLVSYGGRDDALMEEAGAFTSWEPVSPRYLGHSEFAGGHFYIDHHALAVTSDFARHLEREAPAGR